MNRMARSLFLTLALLIAVGLALLLAASFAGAAEPAQQELQDVWDRVRQSGAFRYDAELTQVNTPQPSAFNAGRKSRSTTVYMAGETNLKDEAMHLRMWSNGGSALIPDTGVEIKVNADEAVARKGDGAWEEIPNFTGLFAPGGDFTAYSQATENVVRHQPEVRDTILGPLEVTRYTYDINGRRLAEQMRAEMVQEARKEGLPAGIDLELPRAFAGMTGQGELWVGPDGLPLRQHLDLHYPVDDYNYASSATVTIDFSNFAPVSGVSGIAGLTQFRHTLGSTLSEANNPTTAVAILLLVMVLMAIWLIMTSRSKWVYAAVAGAIILSILSTPLLTARQLSAYNGRQAEKRADQEQLRAQYEAGKALEEQLSTTSTDPHLSPLDAARQKAVARPTNAKIALQAIDTSRYFDPLCDSDPDGDADADSLTNLSECLIGTLPETADTDQDGANDNLEVVGFEWNGETWYTNPLIADTNNDGIADGKEWHLDANNDGLPDDTNGDGTPDLWDDDNDGDGVRDNLDLSPYMSTAPGSAAPKTFNDNSPMLLTMDNLVASELTKVEFQLIPTKNDHLRYSQTVLDWPFNDRQGQLQDADGVTFYDTDKTLDPSPNANGDVRLLPMLEIRMAKDSANLPPSETCTRDDGSTYTCYPILEELNISVREIEEGTLAAYVPLQLVEDSTGDAGVAFYGRMFYQAADTWGPAHEVNLVWMVQMLNDVCSAIKDNICSDYSDYNQLTVIQTYDDEWYLSGLHITEEHESNFALIYEDPQVTPGTPDRPADYDQPLYVDTLYALLYGLDNSFLAGRCSAVDANGKCTANSQREITVDTIYDRFNHSTNSGVSATERWNLPNILSVEKNSYEAYDLGMIDTTVTQTVGILDQAFKPVWSSSEPITPTIMIATEQINRDLNLDELGLSNDNFHWGSQNSLTVNWTNIAVDTKASLKWTPYGYDSTNGWNAADINIYIDSLSDELSSVLDPNDPNTATAITMSTVLYTTVFDGDSRLVELDGQNVEDENAESDENISEKFPDIGDYIYETAKLYFEFDEATEQIAEAIEEAGIEDEAEIGRFVQQISFKKAAEGEGFGIDTILAIAFVLELTEFFVADILHDTQSPFAKGLATTVKISDVLAQSLNFMKALKDWQVAATAERAGTAATDSAAVEETVTEASSLVDADLVLGIIGIIIALFVAVATIIYLAASGKVQAGTPEYSEAVYAAVASIILTVVLTIIAISNPIGAILVVAITLVDAILELAGVKWSIINKLTQALTGVIYQDDLVETTDVSSGALGFTLSDQAAGLVDGAQVQYSIPITSSYSEKNNFVYYTTKDYNTNRFIYTLREEKQDTQTIENEGNWPGWRNGIAHDTPVYTDTLPSGINASPDLTLNTYYYLLTEKEEFIFFWAKSNVEGSESADLSDALVIDVLPKTLDEFVDVDHWTSGDEALSNIDADGDGLIAAAYGGLDPDDTNWDFDGDKLSDGYEMTIRSLPTARGGVALNARSADSDADLVDDNDEMRWGTDPARRDSDGDGLEDAFELGANGGWLMGYAYDPSTKETTRTRVWSDPLQADGDGDGMSDSFEEAQDTLQTSPWADPDNPLIFNPNVWNESPVALYVDDTSSDGFVSPGATIVYSTTTVNNLSSGQSLAGELSLTLPDGVSGGPLTQDVDINSGESGSLVSNLTFNGSSTASYELDSQMRLTDYDQTRWGWDASLPSAIQGRYGTAVSVAVAPVSAWESSYVVAAREQKSGGGEAITAYLIEVDGTVAASATLAEEASKTFTGPDIDCNQDGVCMVLWGSINDGGGGGTIAGARLANNLANPAPFSVDSAYTVSAPSVASDGTDFMAAWTGTDSAGAQTTVHVTPIPAANAVQTTENITSFNSSSGAAAIDWNGSGYTAIWAGDGNVSIADVDSSGSSSNLKVLGPGGGWPRADGRLAAPAIAHDDISGQTLVAYRSTAGELAARRLSNGAGDEFILTSNGVGGDGVTVAVSPDEKNSGWVIAWLPSDGSEVEYRAMSPLGALRGNVGHVDNAALTSVALSCILPRPLVELHLDEEAGTTIFADSSGNNRDAACSNRCPTAGVSGKIGSAVSMNGINEALQVGNLGLSKQSFTVSAWVKRNEINSGRFQFIATTNKPTVIRFAFNDKDQLICNFGTDPITVESTAVYVDTAWHQYACTYEKDTGVMTLYRDGQDVASETQTATFDGASNLYIGRNISDPNENSYLNAEVDELLFADRALSAAEIADVYETATAIFDLDETLGSTTFINAVANGINGTCSDNHCPTMGVEGVAYTAAQFDGVDDFIDLKGTGQIPDKTYTWDFESGNIDDWIADGWVGLVPGSGLRNGESTTFLTKVVLNTEAGLVLHNLPDHDTVTISYDLYVIDNFWRGSRTDIGAPVPSNFTVSIDGALQRSTDFSNAAADTSGEYQLYPVNTALNPFRYNGIEFWSDGTGQYSGCSGINSHSIQDISNMGATGVGDNQLSCVTIGTDTAARLYQDTDYKGTNSLIDVGRKQEPAYADNAISSMRVWPAAYPPKHGSIDETLVVGSVGDDDTAIYHIEEVAAHTQSSLNIAFLGGYEYGLDNVTVEVAKSGTDISLKNSSFTLSAWAKRDAADDDGYLISQGAQLQDQGLRFGFRPDTDFTCAFVQDGLHADSSYTDANWHHWACTYDATTGTRTIYRDGVQIAQDSAAANYIGDGPMFLGKAFDGSGLFQGVIDEVGIWPIALDQDQIADLYTKVKVEDESVLTCQLPRADSSGSLTFGDLTLRETTTRLGDISQTTTHTITVDADNPTAGIDTSFFKQKQPGPYVSSPGSLVVSGQAADATSYIAQVQVQNGSSWTAVDGTETWSYQWVTSALADGPQALGLRAYDAVGNRSGQTSWHTILDTTPPNTSVTAPASTLRPSQNQEGRWLVPISGTAADPAAGGQPGSGATAVEVLLQGDQALAGLAWQDAALKGDGTWSLDYVLPVFDDDGTVMTDPSGNYTINVRATDAIGNITAAGQYTTAPLTLDAAAPEVAPNDTLSKTQVINSAMTIGGPVTGSAQSVEINFTPGEQMDAVSGAELFLPMDENQDTEYFDDQSGANNDATCSAGSCPTTGQPGQRDGALSLWYDTLIAAPIDLAEQSFTLSAWAKRATIDAGVRILTQGSNTTGMGLQFGFRQNNRVTCGFVGDSLSPGQSYYSTDWHHWVCTYDAQSRTRTIYRDGAQVAQDTASTDYQGSGPLFIGSGWADGQFYDGLLDEVIVYQRALADYEVANLYGYGQVTWESASYANGSWSYAIPDGADGMEGLYQINVRGTDAVGNATPLGGQRVWRGEIDTKPPSVTYSYTTDTSGSTTTTTYHCSATDFNLVEDTTCLPGTNPPRPTFGPGNITLTPYADVDEWYAQTYTDTARLYGLDATLVDTRPVVTGQTMTACDKYNHCSEASPTSLPPVDFDAGAEILSPSSGSAITSLQPLTVSGDSYATSGLQALIVTVNNSPVHAQVWSELEATESPWSFTWMPPGEGIYVFQPLVSDWPGTQIYKTYLPFLSANRPVAQDQSRRPDNKVSVDSPLLRDLFASGNWPQAPEDVDDVYAGTPATIYVDLQPPLITIDPTVLGSEQRLGTEYLQLTGEASDSVLLHRVDISVDGGPWQRAGLVGDDGWHLYWHLPSLPALTSDQSFEIRARATDVAGRTTTAVETVIVKAP